MKPLLSGWLHLISFEASLVLGTLALANAHGAVWITAIAVFAASVSAMFGASALYHRSNWAAAWHRRLQWLDHAMIFLLIAGTATPVFLIAAHGIARLAGLIAIWTLTLTAGAIHMAWMNAPERLVGGTFVALDWVAGLDLLFRRLPDSYDETTPADYEIEGLVEPIAVSSEQAHRAT